MADVLGALGALSSVVRPVVLAGGVAFATVAVIDWAARTRRISPFGGIARFMRSHVDPRLAGVERQVVRAGGHPSATPWWGLVAYVLLAALVLATIDVIIGIIHEATFASSVGGAGLLVLVIRWTFRFLSFALIVRVVSSWFPRLAYSPWARWSFGATEWMLRPLRNLLPAVGMLDISPIVAYFGLQAAEWLIMQVLF